MELKVLPTAIAWMGQDCGISEISDLLFAFVRSMPSLAIPEAEVRRENLAIECRNNARELE